MNMGAAVTPPLCLSRRGAPLDVSEVNINGPEKATRIGSSYEVAPELRTPDCVFEIRSEGLLIF